MTLKIHVVYWYALRMFSFKLFVSLLYNFIRVFTCIYIRPIRLLSFYDIIPKRDTNLQCKNVKKIWGKYDFNLHQWNKSFSLSHIIYPHVLCKVRSMVPRKWMWVSLYYMVLKLDRCWCYNTCTLKGLIIKPRVLSYWQITRCFINYYLIQSFND